MSASPDSQLPAPSRPLDTVVRYEGGLAIDRLGMALPTCRCFQCNRDAEHSVRKTYWSAAAKLRLLLLLCPILLPVLLPIYLMRAEKASVEFGFCSECYNKRLLGVSLGVVLLIIAVPLFLLSLLSIAVQGVLPGIVGSGILCAGIFTIGASRRLADAKGVDDRWILLSGGGPAFVHSLPELPGRAS